VDLFEASPELGAGALFELPNPLLADAEAGAKVLQREGFIPDPALLDDHLLPGRELAEGLVDGLAGDGVGLRLGCPLLGGGLGALQAVEVGEPSAGGLGVEAGVHGG
jgi:hypothetical protein